MRANAVVPQTCGKGRPQGAAGPFPRLGPLYGLVVDSVNVSVLLYVPVRNGSF